MLVRKNKQTSTNKSTGGKQRTATTRAACGYSIAAGGPLKHFKRFRPGAAALQAIRKYQKPKNFLIHDVLVHHLAEEITQDLNLNARFEPSAITALQAASEAFLAEFFEDTTGTNSLCTSFSNCVTVTPKGIRLARRIRGDRV